MDVLGELVVEVLGELEDDFDSVPLFSSSNFFFQ
jgi:hypothetical protein